MRNVIITAVLAIVYALAVIVPANLLDGGGSPEGDWAALMGYILWISAFGAGALLIGLVALGAWLFSRCQSRGWATILCGSQVCFGTLVATVYLYLSGDIFSGVALALYAATNFIFVIMFNRAETGPASDPVWPRE